MDIFPTLAIIVGLLIHIAFALRFGGIAEDKGYESGPYFVLCLVFSFVGYILVAALPDMYIRSRLNELNAPDPTSSSVTRYTVAQSSPTPTGWVCGKCNTTNSPNYGQCKKCGTYRR